MTTTFANLTPTQLLDQLNCGGMRIIADPSQRYTAPGCAHDDCHHTGREHRPCISLLIQELAGSEWSTIATLASGWVIARYCYVDDTGQIHPPDGAAPCAIYPSDYEPNGWWVGIDYDGLCGSSPAIADLAQCFGRRSLWPPRRYRSEYGVTSGLLSHIEAALSETKVIPTQTEEDATHEADKR